MVNPIENAAMNGSSIVDDGGFAQKIKTAKQDIGVVGKSYGNSSTIAMPYVQIDTDQIDLNSLLPNGLVGLPPKAKQKLTDAIISGQSLVDSKNPSGDTGYFIDTRYDDNKYNDSYGVADLAYDATKTISDLEQSINFDMSEAEKQEIYDKIDEIKTALKEAGINLDDWVKRDTFGNIVFKDPANNIRPD